MPQDPPDRFDNCDDFVRRYHDTIRRYGFTVADRLLGDHTMADDAVSEALVRLLPRIRLIWERFRLPGGEINIGGLLRFFGRIVINVCYIQMSIAQRESELVNALKHSAIKRATDESVYDNRQQDLAKKVLAAVTQLGTAGQQVIVLYYIENRSIQEIAELMNITPDNAKVRLFRARKRLEDICRRTFPEDFEDFG